MTVHSDSTIPLDRPRRERYSPDMIRIHRGLAALLLLGASWGGLAADELWDRAMAHAAPGYADAAVGMAMRSFEKDRDGRVTKLTTFEMGKDAESGEFIILSAFEDGEDVTERERRDAEKRRERGGDNSEYIHQLFNPEKSGGLTLSPRDTTAIVHGRECRIYDFRFEDAWEMGPGRPKAVVEEGVIFVDLEDGLPLRISSRLVDGPGMIRSMDYAMDARPGPDGSWRVERMGMDFVGQMIVRRAGGFELEFRYED